MEEAGKTKKGEMNGNGETKFLNNIRKALRVDRNGTRPALFCRRSGGESMNVSDRISSRTHSSRLHLLEKMIEAGKTLNLNIIPVKTLPEAAREIIKLASEKKPEWGDEKKVV
ncbi:MAG: dom protein, partial [Thermodesulfobacteriota bacterium]|nr:dom protein [Thermodesulfobacteriota bacterium]